MDQGMQGGGIASHQKWRCLRRKKKRMGVFKTKGFGESAKSGMEKKEKEVIDLKEKVIDMLEFKLRRLYSLPSLAMIERSLVISILLSRY
jgi:hypothetical protein